MEEQQEEPRLEGFPIITDEEQQSGEGLAAAPPGGAVVTRETIFEETSPWVKGAPLGELRLVAHPAGDGQVLINAIFKFDEGSTLTADGILPLVGGTIGAGEVAITGGTRRYRDARGRLPVEVQNPKRWG